jgi:thiamine-monophosphate kinase
MLGGSLGIDGQGRHLTFEPRIAEALELSRVLKDRLHAMIDVSDGLGRDLSHMARMSGLQIVLDAARIPCTPGCDWKRALSDGEDYELAFAAQGSVPAQLLRLPVHEVGYARERPATASAVVVMLKGEMIAAEELGWQHEA